MAGIVASELDNSVSHVCIGNHAFAMFAHKRNVDDRTLYWSDIVLSCNLHEQNEDTVLLNS